MKRMARMSTRKPHSWWWDSHISPKNSKWLSENLEAMDRSVKEMLKLLEEEGDSFAKKAEMYYQKRPELVSHVEDFYRMYRALAERYDHVTGELRRNIPSELQSQGSGSGSDVSSEPPSPTPELTPERKPSRPKPSPRAAGFDFFLGSGGSSDNSRKGSDGFSSSESDSESDSEYSKDVNGDDESSTLNRRILELEKELRDVREKLHEHENGDSVDSSSRISALEKELIAADEKLQVSESEILSLKQMLAEENTSSEAEVLISVLEAEISLYTQEIENLKATMLAASQQFEADLSHRDRVIEESKMEIARLSEAFLQEKTHLEAEVTKLEGVIEGLKEEIEEISTEKSLLEVKVTERDHMLHQLEANAATSAKRFFQENCALSAQVSGLSQSHASLEAKIELLEDEIKRLDAEKMVLCADNGKHIEELNKSLNALKLRTDMLTSEKDELGAKVDTLVTQVKCRDDQIGQMDEHLHRLHLDHANLIAEIDGTRRAGEELRARVRELEEEVDGQRVVILDSAEGKREAIRQLCFSLEHYRDGYLQLRTVLQRQKRPAMIAA